jgi:hypothetical protein
MELMSILEAETSAETQREQTLATVDDIERKRLEKIYGVERARASERIISISEKHDRELRIEMGRLGILL